MTDPVYIERIQPDPEGLDFNGLKRKGLKLLQKLSGKAWTDYNLHDPGVTILEVLCYALTDLVYRTEFEVADFLTGEDELIDFEEQALFRPQDIFPSQAVTRDDYRKLIFDSVPEIDNVWITPVQPSPSTEQNPDPPGLYRISVMLAETAQETKANTEKVPDPQQIKDRVKRLFNANRNLCEDLKQVKIIEPKYYALKGDIEIGGHRNPDNILAQIYFKSSKYLCPGLSFKSYDAKVREGHSLEDIFTGPLTEHGYISADVLDVQPEYAKVSELIGIISDIKGVEFVDSLFFENDLKFIEYDRTLQSMPHLRFPRTNNEIKVTLAKNGRAHLPDLNNIRTEFERLKFEDRALRRIRQDIAKVCNLPHGENRDFRDYYSIQHHFPEIYGLGMQGVPTRVWPEVEKERSATVFAGSKQVRPLAEQKSDSTRTQARARQLKAYLLLFEQIMANYLANLQALSRLFSLDDQLKRSYFTQLLDEKIVPYVTEIYCEPPDLIKAEIKRQLRKYEKFRDRRNLVLDYLLGIYGENFTQNSLRRFNEYYSENKFKHEMILNKIEFLKGIRELSRKRAGGFNYLEKSWDTQETENSAGLQKKVNILLGLRNFKTRPLARKLKPLKCEGCHIVEHILLRPLNDSSHGTDVPHDFYAFKISVLFPAWTPRFENPEFRKLAEETVRLNCPAHVLPEISWLNFVKMQEFESLYQRWLEIKCDTDASVEQVDELSQKLIEFLRDQQVPDSESADSDDRR